MKILVVSSFLPYPLFSGGHVRLFNILKQLQASGHKITLVCEVRKHQTKKDIKEIEKLCEEVFIFDRKKQWSARNIIKASISPYPFLLVGHTLPEMKKKIVELLTDKKFDVIHVETFYVYQNLPKTYIPTVLVEHNIEYQVYKKFVDKAPLLSRPVLSVDVEKIKYWEKLWWKEVTKLVAVSEHEKRQMGRADTVVVSNGVDLQAFPFKKLKQDNIAKEKRILFMGDFKWIQNKAAAEWILKDIWSLVQSSMVNNKSSINLRLWIVGKHIPENIKKYKSKDIIFDDSAPDKTSDIYKKADILLAPIQIGGGTSYKILEAMASGVPVVTTPLGIEGLQAQEDKEALVGKTAEELAKHVQLLLEDQKTYASVRTSARELIEREYTWEKITKILEGVYTDAISKT